MSTPGNLASALNALPGWLLPTTDATAFDSLLIGWVRACGWRAAGIVWPTEGAPLLCKSAVHGNGTLNPNPVPPELADVVRRLRQGEATAAATSASGALRVYANICPAGRPGGAIWAERPFGVPFTEVDKSLIALTARMVEASPAFAAAVGPTIDPNRLLARLEDAAVIAGRMAHDFDNILTGIMGFADLSLPMLLPGIQPATFIAEISKVGQRGVKFTQQLHQLSRSGQMKPSPGLLSAALAKEETRLRSAMAPGLRLEREVPAGLPAVALEAGPLQMVLGHLMDNAAEASPAGGTVRVSALAVELTDADARAYLGKVGIGAHLEVTVTDGGPGIKPEVRRRLFAEPFYTTKVRHRGLGLAVVYRALCVHRGGVRLDSVPPPGTGTVARFVLPLAVARPTAAPATHGATPVGG